MNRRHFLAAAAASLLPLRASIAQPTGPMRTRWDIRGSEGFDALSFLSPLSGDEFYLQHYRDEVAAFAPRLDPSIRETVTAIKRETAAQGTMLSPWLDVIFSSGQDRDLATLISAIDEAETRLRPPYLASVYGSAESWARFLSIRDRLRAILVALDAAGFPAFRQTLFAPVAERRLPEIRAALSRFDVTAEQQRLTGRAFDPLISLVILHFSKPHGIKVQGQQFLAAASYSDATLAFIAAHEMLHPPIPMDGAAARAAKDLIGRDPLLTRVIAEHDPAFGYNDVEGLFNEDLTQALDQMICENLGIPRPAPAVRWTRSDAGMHILAAALYGMLTSDGWKRSGGDIEAWITRAATGGRLSPEAIAAAAAAVLGRAPERLWPLPADDAGGATRG